MRLADSFQGASCPTFRRWWRKVTGNETALLRYRRHAAVVFRVVFFFFFYCCCLFFLGIVASAVIAASSFANCRNGAKVPSLVTGFSSWQQGRAEGAARARGGRREASNGADLLRHYLADCTLVSLTQRRLRNGIQFWELRVRGERKCKIECCGKIIF